MDEQLPSFLASGPSAAVATVSALSHGNMPTIPGETPSSVAADQSIAPRRIPSAGRNGVVITTPHPRMANHPPRIYREGPIGSGFAGHHALYLASTLDNPSINHVRTMGLAENKPPPGSSGRTPYFFTSRNPVERPLAETNNIGRYTNRQQRTGPQLRFQFGPREPQQPPTRPVRRPEPVAEILQEDDGREGGVGRDLERNDEEEGMEIFHLNGSTALF